MLHLSYMAHMAAETLTSVMENHCFCHLVDGATSAERSQEVKDMLKEVYANLFDPEGQIDVRYVRRRLLATGRQCIRQVLEAVDIDNYNILDKAVLYNNRRLAQIVLDGTLFHIGEDLSQYLVDTIHLACFLGCIDVVCVFVDKCLAVLNSPGKVKFFPVAGPTGHKLEGSTVQCASFGHQLQKLHWVKSHPGEIPAYYAICGDHVDLVRMLFSRGISDMHNETCASDLLATASSCASHKCIHYLSKVLPGGLNVRDPRGRAIVARGITHGITYVTVLTLCGVDKDILNNIDGDHSTNALHLFYNDLSKDDKVYPKYRHVYKMTELLVKSGVSVNQTTSAFKSHGILDTPLHLLIDQVNLIITWNMGDYMPFEKWSKLQKYFDRNVLKSIEFILKSGFHIKEFGHSIIERLSRNQQYLLRYKLSNGRDCLAQRNFGLVNVYAILKLLFQHGARLYCARRSLTPLLSFIDGLKGAASPFRTFQLRDFGSTLIGCLRLFLTNGCDPNIHPVSRHHDTEYAPPLIHFLDLFCSNCCHDSAILTIDAVADVKKILELFCKFDTKYVCHMNIEGVFIKHGVYDPVLPLMRACTSVYNHRTISAVHQLILALVHTGAEPIFHPFATRKHSAPGNGDNAAVNFGLLYQWLLTGILGFIHHDGGHVTSIGLNPEYQCLLFMLTNLTDHKQVYLYLQQATLCSIQQESYVDQSLRPGYIRFCRQLQVLQTAPSSLLSICRKAIYELTKHKYARNVKLLPLPVKIKEYLLQFQ